MAYEFDLDGYRASVAMKAQNSASLAQPIISAMSKA